MPQPGHRRPRAVAKSRRRLGPPALASSRKIATPSAIVARPSSVRALRHAARPSAGGPQRGCRSRTDRPAGGRGRPRSTPTSSSKLASAPSRSPTRCRAPAFRNRISCWCANGRTAVGSISVRARAIGSASPQSESAAETSPAARRAAAHESCDRRGPDYRDHDHGRETFLQCRAHQWRRARPSFASDRSGRTVLQGTSVSARAAAPSRCPKR